MYIIKTSILRKRGPILTNSIQKSILYSKQMTVDYAIGKYY